MDFSVLALQTSDLISFQIHGRKNMSFFTHLDFTLEVYGRNRQSSTITSIHLGVCHFWLERMQYHEISTETNVLGVIYFFIIWKWGKIHFQVIFSPLFPVYIFFEVSLEGGWIGINNISVTPYISRKSGDFRDLKTERRSSRELPKGPYLLFRVWVTIFHLWLNLNTRT